VPSQGCPKEVSKSTALACTRRCQLLTHPTISPQLEGIPRYRLYAGLCHIEKWRMRILGAAGFSAGYPSLRPFTLDLERGWIALAKYSRNHTNLPRETCLWESPPTSPFSHLASERIWTSGPKVSRIVLVSRLRADRPDLPMAVDEHDTRASRIVFHDKKGEGQGLHASETLSAGATVGGDGHENDPTGEYFLYLRLCRAFTWISMLLHIR